MTAQAPELIFIDGRKERLYSNPLCAFLASHGIELPRSICPPTNCWRGYFGTWEIRDRRLYLNSIRAANTYDEKHIRTMEDRFFRRIGAKSYPVPATWFNDGLVIALGELLRYRHAGWSNWFERLRILNCVAGRVVRDRIVNTEAILNWRLKRHPEFDYWPAQRLDRYFTGGIKTDRE